MKNVSTNARSADDWEHHWAAFGNAARGNPANVFRSRMITRQLGDLHSGDCLVDIGCGEGDILVDLDERYRDIPLLGVDISQEGIDRARGLVPRASYLRVDLARPGAEVATFNGWATHGVCSEVLEHLDDPVAFLSNARALLKPNSPLIITVPGGPRSAFDHYIGHRRHFTPARLRGVLLGAGLEVEMIRRAGFPFFTAYRLTVIARGKRLIGDATVADTADLSLAARLVLGAYRLLFRFNLPSAPFGWQLVARARVPDS